MPRKKFEAYTKNGGGLFRFDQIETKCTWEESRAAESDDAWRLSSG